MVETGTENHAKKKKQEKSEDLTSQEKEEGDKSQANQDLDDFFRNFSPGVAYFIAYTRTAERNPNYLCLAALPR